MVYKFNVIHASYFVCGLFFLLILTCVAHLSVECKDDKLCLQRDPNSYCQIMDEHAQCTCRLNYHLDLTNRTGKCVYGEPTEEYKEGLAAAPIILCFMGCVVVEAVCLLAFHYWKKYRRTEYFSPGYHLQPVSLADIRFHVQDRGHISFTISPEMESSGARTSPPSYSQTIAVPPNNSQSEESPPPYEEAVKLCSVASKHACGESSNRRKMSC